MYHEITFKSFTRTVVILCKLYTAQKNDEKNIEKF